MTVCPSCGQENAPGAKFCSECGVGLLVATRPREERKVVTVLFADLVGFTAQAERLDPEDVRSVLAPYYARLRTELERFGGTVEKFIGDAVMALFGAPVAHEDDPERAVRAALAIRDWAREESNIQVRIGVNTGEALDQPRRAPDGGRGDGRGRRRQYRRPHASSSSDQRRPRRRDDVPRDRERDRLRRRRAHRGEGEDGAGSSLAGGRAAVARQHRSGLHAERRSSAASERSTSSSTRSSARGKSTPRRS